MNHALHSKILDPFYLELPKKKRAIFRRRKSDLLKREPHLSRDEAILKTAKEMRMHDLDNVIEIPARERTARHAHQGFERVMLTLFILGLGGFLTYIQAASYAKDGIEDGLWFALAAEVSLVVLAWLETDGFHRVLKLIAMVMIFTYALGMQALPILMENEKAIETIKEDIRAGDEETILVKEELKLALAAKATAVKYGDHAGIKRADLLIDELKATPIDRRVDASTTVFNFMRYQAYGLILIRGFLMLTMLIAVDHLRRTLLGR